MNPLKDIRVIIGLIATALVAISLVLGGQKIWSWREGSIQNEVKEETLKATSGIIEDGAKADEDRANTDESVGQARGQFNRDYEGAMQHEPATATRANTVVPDSVRSAFRARRIARERSGCAGEQCGAGPPSSESSER